MKTIASAFAAIILLLASSELGNSAPATINSISPSEGPIAGGTQVTITGSGFTGTTLTLDGAAITTQSASDTQIVFITPPRDNGIAAIKLSGNGSNAYVEFLYLPPELKDLPPGYITTVMGIGEFEGDGREALDAKLSAQKFIVGADESIFLTEPNIGVIRRIRSDGRIERYAGTGLNGNGVDGMPARETGLVHPRGIALDGAGNLFIVDEPLNSVRRVDNTTSIVTTVVGGGGSGFAGDGGPASNALLSGPLLVAFDGLGNLYILDWGNVRVRKVDTNGIITTIAGNGIIGYSGDGGLATNASFDIGDTDQGGLAADGNGNVFLADTQNSCIRRIDANTGVMTTFVADLGHVKAVAVDQAGNIYAGRNDEFNPTAGRILKISPTGQILQ